MMLPCTIGRFLDRLLLCFQFFIMVFPAGCCAYWPIPIVASFVGGTYRPQASRLHRIMRSQNSRRCSYHSNNRLVMMPEGPEVKAAVAELQMGIGRKLNKIEFVSGRYTTKPPDGYNTFQLPATIVDWKCKGKFIYIVLDGKEDESDDFQKSIWITFGMTGRFISEKAYANGRNRHVRWYMEVEDGATLTKVFYADMRNFGTIKFVESRKLLSEKLERKLGPDILSSATSEEDFTLCCSKYEHWNICKLLMDQSKIAGVGNYILAESLYRANINPYSKVGDLSPEARDRLFHEIQSVARESYKALVENNTGAFEYQVYGREVTEQGDPVRKDTKGPHGRTIWFTDRQLNDTENTTPTIQLEVNRDSPGPTAETTEQAQDQQDAKLSSTIASPRASGNSLTRETRGMRKLSSILSSVPVSQGGGGLTEAADVSLVANQDIASGLLETIVDPGWRNALDARLRDLPEFNNVARMLEEEYRRGETVFPPQRDIFAALNLCPLEDLKLVIVGQDPYHGRGQGHGLAFSVRKGVQAPPSLRNIFKELTDSPGVEPPTHGNLEHWARQGVLLLNSVLTVREGRAYSHARQGWETVTDLIIEVACSNQSNIVFLLWGNAAAQKVTSLINPSLHTVIQTSHPSPLGATKTKRPFMGSGCFTRANQALLSTGLDPIDWGVGD